MALDVPNLGTKMPKAAPRCAQDAPRLPQAGPWMSKDKPRMCQASLKMASGPVIRGDAQNLNCVRGVLQTSPSWEPVFCSEPGDPRGNRDPI